ncbi:hypothetical protein AV530_019277 [Patagioenas fasciata monilis]|uniref:Uncharacterized protein n=1 Tax=Patagioenas fasciata monilis TaxID=372326 RepID=A0A1V4JCV6_PATFA|nr:hypothetical protein AV530_019277 [Patagioenas fasciata monilis]
MLEHRVALQDNPDAFGDARDLRGFAPLQGHPVCLDFPVKNQAGYSLGWISRNKSPPVPRLGKLRQVATVHLGLNFVISPESLRFSGWPGRFSLVLLGRRMSIQRCIQTQSETSHLQETFHLEYLLQHILR